MLEPSVLAMLRVDFKHLLDDETCERLARKASSRWNWCGRSRRRRSWTWRRYFPPQARWPHGTRLFYHSHCQQRTCNAATQTIEVLRAAGFDVVTSSVECCGMAGSFGYKRDYYELSMAVGEDLFAQVRHADQEGGPRRWSPAAILSRAVVGRDGPRGSASGGIAGKHAALAGSAVTTALA